MMDGAMMSWFWIWPVLVVIGLALLGYVTYRLLRGRGTSPATESSPSARQILDERYARGEIDGEEYRRRRADLQ